MEWSEWSDIVSSQSMPSIIIYCESDYCEDDYTYLYAIIYCESDYCEDDYTYLVIATEWGEWSEWVLGEPSEIEEYDSAPYISVFFLNIQINL